MNWIEHELSGKTIKRVVVEKIEYGPRDASGAIYNLQSIELKNGEIFSVNHYSDGDEDFCEISQNYKFRWKWKGKP